MIKVVFFQRKPRPLGNYSLEAIFEGVRKLLPPRIQAITLVSRYESNGIWKRVYNTFEAAFQQADVNHVTGDVHFLAILLKGHKTILTVHDCGFMVNPSPLKRAVLKFFWLTLPCRNASWITTISTATKTELLKYIRYDPDRIRVIPVFISPRFQPHPKPFNAEKPVILQIGTAINKNVLRLAEALTGLSCHLRTIGKLSVELVEALQHYGIEYSSYERLSDEDILQQYIDCDIVTLVSTYEGFGMPIVEANAVERVVVTSNILSMPEVAGGAACLANPFDVQDMRKCLLQVIQDENYRNELIAKGRMNKQRFAAQMIVDSYVELYEKVYWETKPH
jgi:glycosyltransferase involved in cell wall biosynthesis